MVGFLVKQKSPSPRQNLLKFDFECLSSNRRRRVIMHFSNYCCHYAATTTTIELGLAFVWIIHYDWFHFVIIIIWLNDNCLLNSRSAATSEINVVVVVRVGWIFYINNKKWIVSGGRSSLLGWRSKSAATSGRPNLGKQSPARKRKPIDRVTNDRADDDELRARTHKIQSNFCNLNEPDWTWPTTSSNANSIRFRLVSGRIKLTTFPAKRRPNGSTKQRQRHQKYAANWQQLSYRRRRRRRQLLMAFILRSERAAISLERPTFT